MWIFAWLAQRTDDVFLPLNSTLIYCVSQILFSIAFAFGYSSLLCSKPPFLEVSCSRSFNQLSEGDESQPQGEAFEPEDSIGPESNSFDPRWNQPCINKICDVYDYCRKSWVRTVECKSEDDDCNHSGPEGGHSCKTVYDNGYGGACKKLPVNCKCEAWTKTNWRWNEHVLTFTHHFSIACNIFICFQ